MTTRNKSIIASLLIVLFCALIYGVMSGMLREAFDALVRLSYEEQRNFSRRLSAAVIALKDGHDGASWTLITLGFTYGIFHAIGPGHGKTIITTYALTHETRLRRTAALSFTAAIIQGLSAISIVGVLMMVIESGLRRAAMRVDDVMTPISFAAVLLVGLYLLVRGVRAVFKNYHTHDNTCGCGHAHVPTPAQVEDAANWRRGALVALAVGIRPCSGAILVLVLAFAFGFAASGIAAVVAMSLGTALTVSMLAITAQSIRWPLAKMFTAFGMKSGVVSMVLLLMGGAAITALGATLLAQELSTPAHPFF